MYFVNFIDKCSSHSIFATEYIFDIKKFDE